MRPNIDDYFMSIALVVGSRSTCTRHQFGAVLVKHRQILSTGYNGAAKGLPHCTDIGCAKAAKGIPTAERHEICRAVHAEQNAIIQAALHGVGTDGSTMYCKGSPCSLCARMMINAGVVRVVYVEEYPDKMAFEYLRDAGVQVDKIKEE